MSLDIPGDGLHRAWSAASHRDDWNVPVVYEETFRALVAGDYANFADKYDAEAEKWRKKRNQLVRQDAPMWQREAAEASAAAAKAFASDLRARARELRGGTHD